MALATAESADAKVISKAEYQARKAAAANPVSAKNSKQSAKVAAKPSKSNAKSANSPNRVASKSNKKIASAGCPKSKKGKAKGKRGKRCGGSGEWGTFFGRSVVETELRKDPPPKPSGELSVFNVNFRETETIQLYTADGGYDPEALKSLDQLFRCKRTNAARQIDPRLYEVLSMIYDHFGKKQLNLVSGYRNQRNQNSRHFHGGAADITIPGVTDTELRDFVQTLDPGGMGVGIYPKSGFIHVDFRAPGQPSYRWTDYSTTEQNSPGKQPPKGWVAPNS